MKVLGENNDVTFVESWKQVYLLRIAVYYGSGEAHKPWGYVIKNIQSPDTQNMSCQISYSAVVIAQAMRAAIVVQLTATQDKSEWQQDWIGQTIHFGDGDTMEEFLADILLLKTHTKHCRREIFIMQI